MHEHCLGLALGFLQSVHTLVRGTLTGQFGDRSAGRCDLLFRRLAETMRTNSQFLCDLAVSENFHLVERPFG